MGPIGNLRGHHSLRTASEVKSDLRFEISDRRPQLDTLDSVTLYLCPALQCFLAYGLAMFFYFHIFTAPCLLFNLFGFVATSWNLCCGIWGGIQFCCHFLMKSNG